MGRFVGIFVEGRRDGLAVGCLVGTGAFVVGRSEIGSWAVGDDVGCCEVGKPVVGRSDVGAPDVGRNEVGASDDGVGVGIPGPMQLYPSAASEMSSLYPDLWR